MVSWALIYGKNLPVRAKDAVPCSFQCQVMWFALPLKLNKIREPASSENHQAVCHLILLLLPVCISYPRILQQERHWERLHILRLSSKAVQRGKHFKTFLDKSLLRPMGVFCRKIMLCEQQLFSGDGSSPEINGSTGLQGVGYTSPQSARDFIHVLSLRRGLFAFFEGNV